MTATVRHANTPAHTKGRYVVTRHWNSAAHDYLSEWDDQYGAAFTGIGRAMTFDTKTEAVLAAIEAKRLVPVTVDGASLWYDAALAA